MMGETGPSGENHQLPKISVGYLFLARVKACSNSVALAVVRDNEKSAPRTALDHSATWTTLYTQSAHTCPAHLREVADCTGHSNDSGLY